MMRDTGNLLGLVLVYGDHGSLRVGACQAWIHVTFGMGVFSQRGQRIPLSVSLYCACQGLCHVHGSGTRQFARGSQSFAGWSHVTLSFGCDDSMPLFLWHHVRGSSSLACLILFVFLFLLLLLVRHRSSLSKRGLEHGLWAWFAARSSGLRCAMASLRRHSAPK